jgi:hypothetical protein
MITDEQMVKPISLGPTAIQRAAACYREWMPDVSFEVDVAFYLAHGCVISRPDCFGMARVIEGPRTKQPAWFVRMSVGPLDVLMSALPYPLPEICLCRGKKGDLRIRSYSFERMLEILKGEKLYGRRTRS